MAVTITTEQIGLHLIRANWESTEGTPSYYIYLDGVLVHAAVTFETMEIAVADGQARTLEIFDTISHTPTPVQLGAVSLRWYATTDASAYRIDEYVANAWVERTQITDGGEWFFSWRSRNLEDVTSHRFRVVPLLDDEEGTAQEMYFFMVRKPDGPGVDYSYDSGTGKVTIA